MAVRQFFFQDTWVFWRDESDCFGFFAREGRGDFVVETDGVLLVNFSVGFEGDVEHFQIRF